MKANTIRLDSSILQDIFPLLKPKQSLAAYVRETLEREVLKQKMLKGAEEYMQFLEKNTNEKTMLEEWETANLALPTKNKAKSKRRK